MSLCIFCPVHESQNTLVLLYTFWPTDGGGYCEVHAALTGACCLPWQILAGLLIMASAAEDWLHKHHPPPLPLFPKFPGPQAQMSCLASTSFRS